MNTYRSYRKDQCERCPATTGLLVHHRDRDRGNNDPANLETLCRSCHANEHRLWGNLPGRAAGKSLEDWIRFEQEHGEHSMTEE